jgi:hypothetical protein
MSQIGNQTTNIYNHKFTRFYLRMSAVGRSLILAAAAAEALEAALAGLVAAEATAQHEEAAATKWRKAKYDANTSIL